VKAAFLAREQSRRTVAVATVLVDRVVGLIGLFWLVGITGTFFWLRSDPCLANASLRGLVIASASVVAASILGWMVMGLLPDWRAQRFAGRLEHVPKVGPSIAELWRAGWMYRRKAGYVAGALAMAMAAQVGMVIGFYEAAQVFTQSAGEATVPSLAEHFLIVPVGLTVQALAPVPGGAGVGELGFGALYFLVLGTAAAQAHGVLASLMARIIGWGLGIVGFVFYLVMKPSLPREAELKADAPALSSACLTPDPVP
jgi:hypothetical protein